MKERDEEALKLNLLLFIRENFRRIVNQHFVNLILSDVFV